MSSFIVGVYIPTPNRVGHRGMGGQTVWVIGMTRSHCFLCIPFLHQFFKDHLQFAVSLCRAAEVLGYFGQN